MEDIKKIVKNLEYKFRHKHLLGNRSPWIQWSYSPILYLTTLRSMVQGKEDYKTQGKIFPPASVKAPDGLQVSSDLN